MLQRYSELAAPVSGARPYGGYANEEDRIILMKDEVYKLPQTHREVQVLSGIAWITLDEQDIILDRSEKTLLPPSKNPVVISALNNVPLILAVW